MDTQVKLEHEVSFRWLIVFALPTILSSIFSSLYSTVDGIFIARLVDTDALSAINITKIALSGGIVRICDSAIKIDFTD